MTPLREDTWPGGEQIQLRAVQPSDPRRVCQQEICTYKPCILKAIYTVHCMHILLLQVVGRQEICSHRSNPFHLNHFSARDFSRKEIFGNDAGFVGRQILE